MSTTSEASLGAPVPVGTVTMYAGAFDAHALERLKRQGWLPCDGSRHEVADYRELYEVLGKAHGGDGSTFLLPDLRGRFVRGVDAGAGRDPDAASREAAGPGGNAGDKVGSKQGDQFRAHAHAASHLPTDLHWAVDEANKYHVAKYNDGSANTDSAGGSETRPVNIGLNFIICFR